MTAAVGKNTVSLGEAIAKESNALARTFSPRAYSRVREIGRILLNREMTVEQKKKIIVRELHKLVVEAFSIDKRKMGKKSIHALSRRLHNMRKLIMKLRSINYFLETVFLESIGSAKINFRSRSQKSGFRKAISRGELEALEQAAYKFIEKAVVLDKKLLEGYSQKWEKIKKIEKAEIKGLETVLRKETELLEHLEAKLPPPKKVSARLLNEPLFTQWVSRVFALLAYFDHIYSREKPIFDRLRSRKVAGYSIKRKISHLLMEKSRLAQILNEKASAMDNRTSEEIKNGLHRITATIGL